jgi:hypothetical protein
MPRALAPRGTNGNGEFIPMTAHVRTLMLSVWQSNEALDRPTPQNLWRRGEEEIGRITYLGFLVAGFFSSKRSASARVGNLLNGIVPDRETTPIWSFANAITILLGTKLAIGHKAPMVDRS